MAFSSMFFCQKGFTMKVTSIENCAGSDGVISVSDNAAITMQDDCSLQVEGCLKMKAFTTAAGTVKVSKNGTQMFQKSINLCRKGSKLPFLSEFLQGDVCPQSENERCVDPGKNISLERFKKMMFLLKGSMAVELNLDHDTGKSCVKIEFEITK
ncbi:uncharacterized protein LOC128722780 [Anopheles nili]|uniref:uncharacterized protein LOC128722780 n=1 Tax=Anopheles nili TaxID=185578 RepID=UPI00237C3D9A|nr:uncharacterized protein LOC128722780 [Anopheles nili]